MLDLNNPGKEFDGPQLTLHYGGSNHFFKTSIRSTKNKKAFIKLCPREQAYYISLEVKSIYRISQPSNLFFFKRDLAPTFLLSKPQRGRLPADHRLNGFVLGGYNLNPKKNEFVFFMERKTSEEVKC